MVWLSNLVSFWYIITYLWPTICECFVVWIFLIDGHEDEACVLHVCNGGLHCIMGYVDILKLCLLHAFYEIKILKPWKLIQSWIQFAYVPFSPRCKPLIEFKQGRRTLDKITSINCQEQIVQGGIWLPKYLRRSYLLRTIKINVGAWLWPPIQKVKSFLIRWR